MYSTPTVTGPLGIELGKLLQQVAGSFVVQPPWLKGAAVVATKVVFVVVLVIVLVLVVFIVPTFVLVLGLLVVVLLLVVLLVVIVAVFIVILVVVVLVFVVVVVEESKGSPNCIVVFVIIGLPTRIQPIVICGGNM